MPYWRVSSRSLLGGTLLEIALPHKSIYPDRSVRNKSRRANQTPKSKPTCKPNPLPPSLKVARRGKGSPVQNKHLNKSMYSDRSVRNKSRRPNQTPSPQASKLQGETRGRPCRREARHQALPTTLPPRLLNFEYRGMGSELAGRTVHRLFFRTYRYCRFSSTTLALQHAVAACCNWPKKPL